MITPSTAPPRETAAQRLATFVWLSASSFLLFTAAAALWGMSALRLHEFVLAKIGGFGGTYMIPAHGFWSVHPGAVAWALPLGLDVVGFVLSLNIAIMSARYGESMIKPRFSLLLVTGLSSMINAIDTHPVHWSSKPIAAAIPVLAVLAFEMFIFTLRRIYEIRTGTVRPRIHPLRWVFDFHGTLEIVRGRVMAIPLPGEHPATAQARAATEAMARATVARPRRRWWASVADAVRRGLAAEPVRVVALPSATVRVLGPATALADDTGHAWHHPTLALAAPGYTEVSSQNGTGQDDAAATVAGPQDDPGHTSTGHAVAVAHSALAEQASGLVADTVSAVATDSAATAGHAAAAAAATATNGQATINTQATTVAKAGPATPGHAATVATPTIGDVVAENAATVAGQSTVAGPGQATVVADTAVAGQSSDVAEAASSVAGPVADAGQATVPSTRAMAGQSTVAGPGQATNNSGHVAEAELTRPMPRLLADGDEVADQALVNAALAVWDQHGVLKREDTFKHVRQAGFTVSHTQRRLVWLALQPYAPLAKAEQTG